MKIDETASTTVLFNVLGWHEDQIKFLEHQPEKHQDPDSVERSVKICAGILQILIGRGEA